MMESDCKGCKTYDFDEGLQEGSCRNGLDPHVSKTHSCPCINCIVKMVCENACKKFRRYRSLTVKLAVTGDLT